MLLKQAVAIVICVSVSGAVTLEEAVGTALDARGDVQASRSAVESASWSRRSASLWFLPSVYGSLSFAKLHDIPTMTLPGMGSFPMSSEYSSAAGITATLPLFVAQGPAGSSLASHAEDLAVEQASMSEQDAALQVIQAFYGVLLAHELDAVSQEALSIAEAGLEIAQQKYEVGTISRFELLQSSVAYENRVPDAISAANSYRNSLAGLAVAMGLPDSAGVVPEGSLEDRLPVELPESLELARAVMTANSPDLRMAGSLGDVGRSGVGMAAAAFAPSLVLQTSYEYDASRDDLEFGPDDYERSWTTAVALTVPIFDGLGDFAGYNSARADQVAADARAGALAQAAGLRLVQAWNDLVDARQMVASTASTVSEAEEGSQIAGVSYEAGLITRLEMDQALLALTAARTNHASALYSLRTSEARLARAMGTLVF